jgi:hypothetical protein
MDGFLQVVVVFSVFVIYSAFSYPEDGGSMLQRKTEHTK